MPHGHDLTHQINRAHRFTEMHRLTLYKGESFGELYGLRNDPLESHNRFNDPAYQAVKVKLTEALAQEMMMNMETSPRAIRRA